MIRVFLAILAMFFLPFFAYAAYNFVRRRGDIERNLLEGAPINWLALAGTILAVGTLARLVSMEILEYEQPPRVNSETSASQKPGASN